MALLCFLRIDTLSLQAQGGQRRQSYFNILRDISSNLQTKLFYQTTDHTTNEYGSKIIGHKWIDVRRRGIDAEGNVSTSGPDQQINELEPEAFNLLRTGATENGKTAKTFVL